jgi:4'-phosphopantetheinyl transferase
MRWMACGEHEVPDGVDWMSQRERSRLDQVRFTKRRTEFLLRRWTGKRAVAVAVGWPPDDALARIEMLNHPTGAPYVEIDGAPGGMDVSLTDRAGWAVGLVGAPGTTAGSLGVDLELVEPRTERFVADFLTAGEAAYVHGRRDSHGQDGWDAAANLLWSAKESALKVLRVGLRADTRTVEVEVDHRVRDDGWAALTVRSVRGETFPGWWRRDGVFVLTIAFARPHDPPALMAGGADLAAAEPVHSWLAGPSVG